VGDHGAGQLSPLRWRSPIQRSGPGSFSINLDPSDRDLLRALPGQLREALAANPEDPSLRRLFPPAYVNDPEAEQEYRRLMGPDLDSKRSQSLDTLVRTADATQLSAEDLEAWLSSLNDLRLWLGTLLDVSEDDDPEEHQDVPHLLYSVLTILQDLVIEALSQEL
jgi:hypothetical protein